MNKIELTDELECTAKKLSLAGDQTRIRILCLMYEYDIACVSEIASALDMSVAAVSHHLQLMKEYGFFKTEREGTNVRYRLVDSDFIQKLRAIVCDC